VLRVPGSFGGTERFSVRRKLGSGAMGSVYQALDRESGGDVAIKVLTHLDPHNIQRFKNEFRRLADVQHENLVQLGELFSVDDQWFFTMELVLGSDLLRFVHGQSLTSYDEQRLRHAIKQLAVGTAALHAADIVHRDIKPSNVVASYEGRVVLLDFGLATPALPTEQSQSSTPVGTIAYMAPEQAAGKPASPSADWYSVGVVLYEALTGRLPFTGSGIDIMLNKQRHEAPPPSAVLREVPADLDALCVALLRHDPAQRPAADEVLSRLGVGGDAPRRGAASRASTGSHTQHLIGREEELAKLERSFESRRPGNATMISIRGASGVGKSALAREFCERSTARWPDTLVLAGRCYERESVPYKAFDGIVDSLSAALISRDQVDVALLMPEDAALLGKLFPSLRQVPAVARISAPRLPNPQELRARAFGAMRQLFVRLAQQRPLLLCIDDFQWADPDSLALLGELLHGPHAPELFLIATIREQLAGEQPVLPWTPPASCDHAELSVDNLAPHTAELLARRLLSTTLPGGELDLAALAREAGGHPLFLQELVRHASSRRGAALGERVTLDAALWARVSELDAPARRLVEVISVASRPLAQKAAFVAAELPLPEGPRWAALLRVAHLARTGGQRDADAIEPYHDRVRECVSAHLAPDALQSCHRRIAAALEGVAGAGAELEALVFHLAAAGEAERARSLAVRAADDAEQVLAFDRAAELYLEAIELGHPDSSLLWTRRGEALAAAGRGRDAATAFERSAESAPDAASALEGRRRATEQLLISGHIAEGMAALRTVLDAIGVRLPATPLRALLSLLWRRLLVRLNGLAFRLGDGSDVPAQELIRVDIYASAAKGLSLVDVLRGADFQARHVLLALRTGEPGRVARALALEAGYAALSGASGGRRAERALRLAESLSSRTTSPWAGAIVVGAWSIVHYQRGRWLKAHETAKRAEQLMVEQCTGVAWELDTARAFSLYSLYYMGRLGELSRRVPALVREAQERGDLYATTNLRVGLLNSSWLVRGELEAARAMIDVAEREWTTEGFHVQHCYHTQARCHTDLYAGDYEAAHVTMERTYPRFLRAQYHRVEIMRVEVLELRGRCLVALAAHDARRRPELLGVARRLAARLLREPAAWSAPLGLVIQGACAAQDGQSERAAELFGDAGARFEQLDMHAHALMARWNRDRLLGGQERTAADEAAQQWASEQGIADAERWRWVLAPGVI
jgi:serine/threonine protein kinase/tetratricopeptide (TPR) repeat protein